MNYTELYNKIQSREIVLPTLIEVTGFIWEEFELDEGCRAVLTNMEVSKDDDVSYQLFFDFSEYVKYNENYWLHDYYDNHGIPKLQITETSFFNALGNKCDCFVTADDECELSFLQVESKLKLYYQCNGVYGSIAVIAKSLDEAREIMKKKHNYTAKNIQEHEIVDGLCLVNFGDL